MKLQTLISVIALSAGIVSCAKTKTNKVEIPEVKEIDTVVERKSGLKCNLYGITEQKEIFLRLQVKDGKQIVSFHDFIDDKRVSIIGAMIENYRTLSFELTETIVDEKIVSIGSSILLPSEKLDIDGEVITSTGRLTVDYGFRGLLEVSHIVKIDDNKPMTTKFEKLVKIEACDKFEAVWL